MRDILHGAVAGVRDVLDGVMGSTLSAHNTISEDEQLAQYMAHRGKPHEMAAFVLDNAPEGVNPLEAMRSYEASMEKLLTKRNGV